MQGTRTAEKLKARAEELPQGSLRRRAMEGAQRFKAAWVEFGRLLAEVKREGLWRGWGYPSFETYCAKELFVRKQTAEKLTQSYAFLERHEPNLAKEKGEGRAPPFEVIEVLSRAEAAGRLSDSGWREMREEVLENAPSPSSLGRMLAERFGPPPAPPRPSPEERLQKIAHAARRLADACRLEPKVPRPLAERVAALAEEFSVFLDG